MQPCVAPSCLVAICLFTEGFTKFTYRQITCVIADAKRCLTLQATSTFLDKF